MDIATIKEGFLALDYLTEDEKKDIIAKIDEAELMGDEELFDVLTNINKIISEKKDKLEEEIDNELKTVGVNVDDDLELKKSYDEMTKQVAEAEEEFSGIMDGIVKEAETIEKEGKEALDKEKIAEIEDDISNL